MTADLRIIQASYALSAPPESSNSKPETRIPKLETRNQTPGSRNPKLETRNPDPETRNPILNTRNPFTASSEQHPLNPNP